MVFSPHPSITECAYGRTECLTAPYEVERVKQTKLGEPLINLV
jgi:hypothetical protein